jgi:hypothetical protein
MTVAIINAQTGIDVENFEFASLKRRLSDEGRDHQRSNGN